MQVLIINFSVEIGSIIASQAYDLKSTFKSVSAWNFQVFSVKNICVKMLVCFVFCINNESFLFFN